MAAPAARARNTRVLTSLCSERIRNNICISPNSPNSRYVNATAYPGDPTRVIIMLNTNLCYVCRYSLPLDICNLIRYSYITSPSAASKRTIQLMSNSTSNTTLQQTSRAINTNTLHDYYLDYQLVVYFNTIQLFTELL